MAGNAVVGEERGRVTDLYVTGWLFAPCRGRWRLLDPTSRRRASSDASAGASAYDASHQEFCFPAAQVSSFLTFIAPQPFLIRQIFVRSKDKKPWMESPSDLTDLADTNPDAQTYPRVLHENTYYMQI